ncbi:MAG: glycosyltransferase family 4 protein [Dehalococcoidia bacterium]
MSQPAKEQLKIALVAPYDLSVPGGVNAHIRSLASALRGLGHEAQIYGPASQPQRLPAGEYGMGGSLPISLAGTVSGLSLNPMLDRQVRDILRRERFDVVHIHEPMTPMLPWLFLRNARVPRVGTFHVHREDGHRVYAAFGWFLRRLMKMVDARIAVSEAARQTVAQYFPGEYEMLPNGVEVARFRGSTFDREVLSPGFRDILFLGRLEGRKGVTYLLRAMPMVLRSFPDARLVIVGDGPERAQAEALARTLSPQSVVFAGPVDDESKPAYFRSAEIFCSPATHGESFGIVLLEAMAAGKPIVASAIEGYAGLLLRDDAGLLVPPRDPEALATAIIKLLSDDALRSRLGQRAAAAAQKYDWQAIAQRIEAIYRELIAARA